MRILQLIDSLEPGGAEKMAVSYANALLDINSFSALVTTRKEGELKKELAVAVKYLALNRKSVLDIKALFRLRKFVKENKITFVQAHSSSFFLAFLLKCVYPSLKIIWHDHFGNSEFLHKRENINTLKIASLFFYRIIAVNEILEKWAKVNLYCNKVLYLPNFVAINKSPEKINLYGISGKRILCLANFRKQKNHLMLLEVARKIVISFPDWTFHLVGKDFHDEYSAAINDKIISNNLQQNVYTYGSVNAIESVINQSTIGVLTSLSEGLPVSLLEYGYLGLPVVVTAVGEIPKIIKENNGILINSEDAVSFEKELTKIIQDEERRKIIGTNLKQEIHLNYSKKVVVEKYLKFIRHDN
ncbi:glycosyltransferase family 4 protein [Flavobacterium inviolabile]|uniref:glycosyltransferase family 4 protein n=1 Tax=Flavobacterium inviolabile TaxID=2748320 RepID=UPI0015A8B504|nr:glycosyltransferase family 4 protein [Flavobacterium inviolabile]